MDVRYQYILESNNPDKDIEYFWMSYIRTMEKYMHPQEKKYMLKLSATLNTLQKLKEYKNIITKIDNYMKLDFPKFGWRMLKDKNIHNMNHVIDNLKRWNLLRGKDFEVDKKIYYFMSIVKICSRSKNTNSANHLKLLELCYTYADCAVGDNCVEDIEIDIINHAISAQMGGVIECLRNIFSLREFIDIDKIMKVSGFKLLRYLTPI
jgi:hypothetical protein